MSRVGCIYTVAFRYYDIHSNQMKIKKRPFLIIKEADARPPVDLTALPVSSISDKSRINSSFDIKISKTQYPLLNLTRDISYVRANKVQTINEKDLIDKVSDDCRKIYPELFTLIRDKVSQYYSDTL